jgi:hypothetical protein
MSANNNSDDRWKLHDAFMKLPKLEGDGQFFDFSKRLNYKSLEPPNFFFDNFCPSISEDMAEERRCGTYHKYFSSLSIFSDGEQEDIEELGLITDGMPILDDIGMPILDENDPDLAVFEDL